MLEPRLAMTGVMMTDDVVRLAGSDEQWGIPREPFAFDLSRFDAHVPLSLSFNAVSDGLPQAVFRISVSEGGGVWMSLGERFAPPTRHVEPIVFDLDGELASIGIRRDSMLYLRFDVYGPSQSSVSLSDLTIDSGAGSDSGSESVSRLDPIPPVGIASSPALARSATLAMASDGSVSQPLNVLGGEVTGTLPAGDYTVASDMVVPQQHVWTIEPGTTLKFAAGSSLIVRGTLVAQGRSDAPIVLTSDQSQPAPGDWSGIVFDSIDQTASSLNHTEIAFAEIGIRTDPESDPDFSIENSLVHFSQSSGIQLMGGAETAVRTENVKVANSTLSENGLHGIEIIANARSGGDTEVSPLIEANEIHGNQGNGISVSATYTAIAGQLATRGLASPRVTRNWIRDNAAGIRVFASDPANTFGEAIAGGDYFNNVIVGNQSHAVQFTQTLDGVHQANVINNTISDNAGDAIQHGVTNFDVGIRNNNVTDNVRGMVAAAPFAPESGQIGYNNLFNNTQGDWLNYPSSFGTDSSTNVNGTPVDDENNMSRDPLFRADATYRVEDASPINDAGTTAGAPHDDHLGAFRYAIWDIGAYEHDSVDNVVTTHIDEDDGALGLGTGNSLREIIQATNSRPIADTITFSAELSSREIVLNGTPLPTFIDDTVVLNQSEAPISVDAGGASSVFFVGPDKDVSIEGLQISNAVESAIVNDGSLTISNSRFSLNQGTNGGAIFSSGTLHVDQSVFLQNSASREGGALFVLGPTQIVNSTLADNQAGTNGGGISAFGDTTLSNSTVSGNRSGTHGGGIALAQSRLTAINSTIANNVAGTLSGPFTLSFGGGIYGNRVLLHNSILADNRARNGAVASDLTGADANSSHNLISDSMTAGGLVHNVGGNLVGVSPLLLPLSDNGGAAPTHLLFSGSPAIDAGDNEKALDPEGVPLRFDARGEGFRRVVDGNQDAVAVVDVGATEFPSSGTIPEVFVGDGNAQRSYIDRLTLRFSGDAEFDETSPPFLVFNRSQHLPVDVDVHSATDAGDSIIELTFVPGASVDASGGLIDGNYQLIVAAGGLTINGELFDGDGNGTPGGEFVFGDEAADQFFRLFGDSDGDRDVDLIDFGQLGRGLLKRSGDREFPMELDHDQDGDIDGADQRRFLDNLLTRLSH